MAAGGVERGRTPPTHPPPHPACAVPPRRPKRHARRPYRRRRCRAESGGGARSRAAVESACRNLLPPCPPSFLPPSSPPASLPSLSLSRSLPSLPPRAPPPPLFSPQTRRRRRPDYYTSTRLSLGSEARSFFCLALPLAGASSIALLNKETTPPLVLSERSRVVAL